MAVACRVEKWRSDPYYGKVAVVQAGPGYVVGDFTGWIHGAFRDYVELPPGVYRLLSGGGEVECVVEPPSYPWHFAVPYMSGDWGGAVELRIYAPEPPEVPGGEVVELMRGEQFSIYMAAARRRRYEVRCCGKKTGFRSPPYVGDPGIRAMYEVLPDRSANRLGCRDLRREFCGGTLKDVARVAVDASRFADALYLHPIYPAMSYHRYDVVDHFQVDERLGGWAAFEAMRGELSRAGLKLVLDIVLYHVGLRNPLFPGGPFIIRDGSYTRLVKELAARLPRSALAVLLGGDPPYETFLKVWFMPRLDYSRPEAAEYARKVVEFWTPHVDGFRLDVAHGVPPGVWEEVLSPAEGRYVLGEHVGNPAPFYKAVRGFTAYVLYNGLINSLTKGAEEVADAVNRYLALTPPSALPYMNTFLENHDVDRAATRLGGHAQLSMGYALLFSLPGVPSIYSGGECGEGGLAADHTNRRPHTPCPDSQLAKLLETLYRLRSRGLGRGPLWASAKRGRIELRSLQTRVEVGSGGLVFGDTWGVREVRF